MHGFLGLPYFFSFPHGLVCLFGISSCQTNSLGFCSSFLCPSLFFSSCYGHKLVNPLVFYLFLWALIAQLLYFYLFCTHGLASYYFLSCWPIGRLPFLLDFHNLFTLLLPLVVSMGLLAIISYHVGPLGVYLFSWTFIAHLLYFTSRCAYESTDCYFLPYKPIRFLPLFLGSHDPFASIRFLSLFSSIFLHYWAICQKRVSTLVKWLCYP